MVSTGEIGAGEVRTNGIRKQYDDHELIDRFFARFHPGVTRPTVSLSDVSVFPMSVTTFAPKVRGTTSYVLTVTPDGREIEEIG